MKVVRKEAMIVVEDKHLPLLCNAIAKSIGSMANSVNFYAHGNNGDIHNDVICQKIEALTKILIQAHSNYVNIRFENNHS